MNDVIKELKPLTSHHNTVAPVNRHSSTNGFGVSRRSNVCSIFTHLVCYFYKYRCNSHGCIYIFFWIPYWPRMLINILWPPLDANQYGGRVRRTGSIFSCCKGLWDVFLPKPITTKHQSVFWLVSQSRHMSAICVGSCRWISLAAACADPVSETDLMTQPTLWQYQSSERGWNIYTCGWRHRELETTDILLHLCK